MKFCSDFPIQDVLLCSVGTNAIYFKRIHCIAVIWVVNVLYRTLYIYIVYIYRKTQIFVFKECSNKQLKFKYIFTVYCRTLSVTQTTASNDVMRTYVPITASSFNTKRGYALTYFSHILKKAGCRRVQIDWDIYRDLSELHALYKIQ